MDLVNISIGAVAVVATLAGSWHVGKRASYKAALEQADIIIGMLARKVALLEEKIQELKERLGE
jgi:hypothetical protein